MICTICQKLTDAYATCICEMCLKKYAALRAEKERLKSASDHMDACRELIKAGKDETLFDAIERLRKLAVNKEIPTCVECGSTISVTSRCADCDDGYDSYVTKLLNENERLKKDAARYQLIKAHFAFELCSFDGPDVLPHAKHSSWLGVVNLGFEGTNKPPPNLDKELDRLLLLAKGGGK